MRWSRWTHEGNVIYDLRNSERIVARLSRTSVGTWELWDWRDGSVNERRLDTYTSLDQALREGAFLFGVPNTKVEEWRIAMDATQRCKHCKEEIVEGPSEFWSHKAGHACCGPNMFAEPAEPSPEPAAPPENPDLKILREEQAKGYPDWGRAGEALLRLADKAFPELAQDQGAEPPNPPEGQKKALRTTSGFADHIGEESAVSKSEGKTQPHFFNRIGETNMCADCNFRWTDPIHLVSDPPAKHGPLKMCLDRERKHIAELTALKEELAEMMRQRNILLNSERAHYVYVKELEQSHAALVKALEEIKAIAIKEYPVSIGNQGKWAKVEVIAEAALAEAAKLGGK